MRARTGPAPRKGHANCFMMTLLGGMTMFIIFFGSFLFGDPYLGTPRRQECVLLKMTGLV